MNYIAGTYDSALVLLSFGVACFASYTSLNLAARAFINDGQARLKWLLGGAFAMGAGIWSMHFVGMLAFSLPIAINYDISLTALSLALAVGVSGWALYIVNSRTQRRPRLLGSGLLMGLGISAMHYTGMYAMRMNPAIEYDPLLFSASILIAIAASVAALRIVAGLREEQVSGTQAKKVISALVMGLAIICMHYTGMAAARIPADSVCMVGGDGVSGHWVAITVSITTLSILSIALLLSVADSRLVTRTAGLVHSLSHANKKLQHLALHDSLTGLPNRLLLEDRITQALASAQRSGKLFAIMFIDLDRFKSINDSHGHHHGDEVLREVAQRLSGTLRLQDTLARLGGDEFIVLLKEFDEPQAAAHIASRMLAALAKPLAVDGQEHNVSCSIGISIYPNDGADLSALMVNADVAMYHAKRMGRDNFQFFTPEMNVATSQRLELERSLKSAIEKAEFEIYYQPKVLIESDEIRAVEALVRWRHPQKGLISPAEFIPLAEEMGLIIPLGVWVLQNACRQNKQWQDAGHPKVRMAVNLSAVQFSRKDLVETIEKVLAETGLEACWLELEVTESVVMQSAEEAALTLQQLHAKGIHISIDDFGTGYSSLSYLKRFPLDTLKIDRSFVRDVDSDPDDAAIVRSVIALAHSLRLRVIAEGVENEAQLSFLRALGCDEYQGFHRSKPVPAHEFELMLKETGESQRAA